MKEEGKAQEIKSNVRQYYGRSAQVDLLNKSCCETPSSCCAPVGSSDCDAGPAQQQETTLIRSWGCGDPVGLAGLRQGEVVLDLGSGGGLDALRASQRVGPEGFVYGLDMTDEMLALARRNAGKIGAGNVEFLKGDIEDIPLPDESVDVIISNCVVNLTPDKRTALHEAWRVLRPGGRLAISDIVIEAGFQGLGMEEDQIRANLNWEGCIAGALTDDQFRRYLGEAGFEDIRIEVQYRFTQDVFQAWDSEFAQAAEPAFLEALAQRFTSCAIFATRPA